MHIVAKLCINEPDKVCYVVNVFSDLSFAYNFFMLLSAILTKPAHFVSAAKRR